MKRVRPSQPALQGVVPYDPKYLPAEVMISANENPSTVPDAVLKAIREEVAAVPLNRYPDPLANELRDMIAQANGLERENVLLGNGGDELLFDLALAWGGPGRTMLNVPPTFSVYAANAHLVGANVVDVPRLPDFSLDEQGILDRVAQGGIDFIIITSPNNPTGKVARTKFLLQLLDVTDALVMVDEAYDEFAQHSIIPYIPEHENLVVLRTFSKAYSLAGVRLGYILASENVIREFIKVRQPYSVDAVSQAIGRAVYANRALFAPGIRQIMSERARVLAGLRALPGVEAFDSDANYILFRLANAGLVWERLLDAGVLVRDFSRTPRLEDCLRVTIGSPAENDAFLAELDKITTNDPGRL